MATRMKNLFLSLALVVCSCDMPRAADTAILGDHFFPLSNPAGQAAHGKEDREHVHRKAQGAIDDARIEIDIGIELPFLEIVVGERCLFELLGEVEQRI